MQRNRFTQAEAQDKVGRRIKSLIEFSGVPQGTTGRVVKADEIGDGYDVVIEWDLARSTSAGHHRPMQDWFVKDEYEKYLQEE